MAVNSKAIRARIKSVTNTKKITKAMEMVSAAKMRRSVDAALNTREYATVAKELLDTFASAELTEVALLEARPVKKVLAIVVSSNRGLCGSFNANLFKKASLALKDTIHLGAYTAQDGETNSVENSFEIDVLGIGKKSALFAKREGYNLIGVYDNLGDKPSFEDILQISGTVLADFKEKKYDKVIVLYTNYVNSLNQIPKIRQLLPVSSADLEKMIQEAGGDDPERKPKVELHESLESYEFEPGKQELIEFVLPRLVETQLFQAVLESAASEHSARMVAMKNATENAGELIKELTLTFNKARQAAITQEIAEIAGGAAALG